MVDEKSVHPGKQRFEKMIAGMYLGEIVRLILLDLCKEGIVFGDDSLEILERKGTLYINHSKSETLTVRVWPIFRFKIYCQKTGLMCTVFCLLAHPICNVYVNVDKQ